MLFRLKVIQTFKEKQNVYLLIQIIEMAQFYYSSKVQSNSPHMGFAQTSSTESQSATIQNLRRQNLLLKQQLETMMKNQTQKVVANNQIVAKMYHPNSEEQAEQAYRDKIYRLKMKKSPRNSIERNATIANSPRNSIDYKNTTNNTPRNSLKASQIITRGQNDKFFRTPNTIPSDNSKLIISSKQKYLNINQTNQCDRKIITARKNNPSQSKMISFIPTNENTITLQQKEFRSQPRHQRPTHQRVESYQPQSVYLSQKTQRTQQTQQRKCHSPYPVNQTSKQRVHSRDNHLQYELHNYRISQQLEQKGDIICIKRQLAKKKMVDNSLKVNVSKGALNNTKPLKAVKQQNEMKKYKDQLLQGDSCLSIQRNMRQEKVNRKLKYQVYMEEILKQKQ